MAEYIEREALLKKAIEARRFVFQMEGLLNNEVVFRTVYKDLAEFVLSVPAADVAPVVRCKNCKHYGWEQEPCHGRTQRFCKLHKGLVVVDRDTFCSYGERKDGDGNV